MHTPPGIRSLLALVGLGLSLSWLTLACGPGTGLTPAPTAVVPDAFAVVRATSQAAFAAGQTELAAGRLEQALVDLDTAKTNDPDQRPEIDQALQQALSALAQQTPSPAPTAAQRPIVVATVPAIVGTSVATGPGTSVATSPGTSVPAGGGTSVPTGPGTSVPTDGFATWTDPQGRFALGAPGDWAPSDPPQSLFGTSAVEFRDPTNRAEVDVAVDSTARAVSPELYAASMDIVMQAQVPGYAGEQMQPTSTAGNPSVKRVFTFTQRDAAGADHQARGFQVTLVKGSTPYIIAGSAPAADFAEYAATFDQVVRTFRFS